MLYYVIRAAVRAGIIDAEREMGKIKMPVTKDDKLQEQREALQEERVRAIVADEQRKQAAKAAKEQGKQAQGSPHIPRGRAHPQSCGWALPLALWRA